MIHRTEESKRKERSLKYKNLKSKSKTNSEAGRFGVWSGGSHHLIRGWQALAGRLCAPDLPRILGNGAVAGELARGGYVPDHGPRPLSWVL